MTSINPSSFGRLIAAVRRYPGGTENLSIFFMLSRGRAASRALIPSRRARRTFRYSSTVKMLPPSLSPERAKVAEFYSAGSGTIPPLPWQTFPPPFSRWLDEIDPGFLTMVISAETGADYRDRDVLDQVARIIEIFGVAGAAE